MNRMQIIDDFVAQMVSQIHGNQDPQTVTDLLIAMSLAEIARALHESNGHTLEDFVND